MSDRAKLGDFLKEVMNWNWAEFCLAEKDPKYKAYEAAVFSLIRVATEKKLGAIKLAIARVDGNLVTPLKVEYPKIYYTYPYATSVADMPAGELPEPESLIPQPSPDEFDEPEKDEENLLSYTLRETLKKMADTDRRVVPLVLQKKKEVEEALEYGTADNIKSIPLVKSVISASLLNLAIEQNNFDAITEVFDQIDGKLVETYKILGDDLYITQYSSIAPPGAEKNEKGIYVFEQPMIADIWKQKLSQK